MTNRVSEIAHEGVSFQVLDGRGGVHDLPSDFAGSPLPEGGTLWVHVDFSDPDGVAWVREESGLDEIVADALVEDDSRPRTLDTEQGVLTIFRGVNLNPGSTVEDMISIRLWLEEARIISASRRRLRSLDQLREALRRGRGPRAPAMLVTDLIERLLDRIAEVTEKLEDTLEEAENRVGEHGASARRTPFSEHRRKIAGIRRYLAPQRDALDRLSRITDSVFDRRDQAELREQTNRLMLIIEDLDLIRERAMVAQEEFLGIVAHEQNSRMFLLSIVAAIFLPLSYITGLMGMNVAGLPGTENQWAFGILVALMILIGGGILLLFRLKNWF